jgi:hypothetical protein
VQIPEDTVPKCLAASRWFAHYCDSYEIWNVVAELLSAFEVLNIKPLHEFGLSRKLMVILNLQHLQLTGLLPTEIVCLHMKIFQWNGNSRCFRKVQSFRKKKRRKESKEFIMNGYVRNF